jgi:transcription initiation factor TFIIB
MSIDETVCNYCEGSDLVEDEETGEIICAGCGLVVSEVKLVGRDFIEEGSKERTGKVLSHMTQQKMNRLMIIDRRLRADSEDPSVLREANQEIRRLVQTIHLPDSVERNAKGIYRDAQEDGLVIRGNIAGFAAASVYAACRVHGLPRTLREVSQASSEDVKDIARMYRILVSELNISVELDNPLNHLSRIASALGLSYRSEQLAVDILNEVMRVGYHTGKRPKGLAASALYIACKSNREGCTQKDLSEAAEISTVTIRKRIKGILENVEMEKLVKDTDIYSAST